MTRLMQNKHMETNIMFQALMKTENSENEMFKWWFQYLIKCLKLVKSIDAADGSKIEPAQPAEYPS